MLFDMREVTIDGITVPVEIWEESNGWDKKRNIRLIITAHCPLRMWDYATGVECNHPAGGVCYFDGENGDEDGYCPLKRRQEV